MKILIALLLLLPSLSWGENHELTREEMLEKLEEFKDMEEKKEVDQNLQKRNVWIAKCYLDARKDADISTDNDALLVQKYCQTLGYDEYPKLLGMGND